VSSGDALERHEAIAVADGLVAALGPSCERIEVAGSLRRGTPTVRDVELVAVPRISTREERSGLFIVDEVEVDHLYDRVEELVRRGVLEGRHPPRRGHRYQALRLVGGANVDLFAVRPPAQWGAIMAIRTGPAAYSQRVVEHARSVGLHVAKGAVHRGGLGCGKYECEVVDTPEEADYFAALGLPLVPPEARR